MPQKKTNLPERRRGLPRGLYYYPRTRRYFIRYKERGKHKVQYFATPEEAEEAMAFRRAEITRNRLLGMASDRSPLRGQADEEFIELLAERIAGKVAAKISSKL